MKYNIPTHKEVDLPEYGQISDMKFKLSERRRFKYGPQEDDMFTLNENEVHYETVFGWGVDVNIHTMVVVSEYSKDTYFYDEKMIEISKEEYNLGHDLIKLIQKNKEL